MLGIYALSDEVFLYYEFEKSTAPSLLFEWSLENLWPTD